MQVPRQDYLHRSAAVGHNILNASYRVISEKTRELSLKNGYQCSATAVSQLYVVTENCRCFWIVLAISTLMLE
jgi:hypothetical protein